jgi:hypothetical protein
MGSHYPAPNKNKLQCETTLSRLSKRLSNYETQVTVKLLNKQ